MQCKRGHSPPATPRRGAPLQLHAQAAPVEVIAVAALGCLLGIPGPARESGGAWRVPHLPSAPALPGAAYHNCVKASSSRGKAQLLSNNPWVQRQARHAAPGVLKLHKRKGRRPRWQLQVNVPDAAILRSSPPHVRPGNYTLYPLEHRAGQRHDMLEAGRHDAQVSMMARPRISAPCRTGPLSRAPARLLAGCLHTAAQGVTISQAFFQHALPEK